MAQATFLNADSKVWTDLDEFVTSEQDAKEIWGDDYRAYEMVASDPEFIQQFGYWF